MGPERATKKAKIDRCPTFNMYEMQKLYDLIKGGSSYEEVATILQKQPRHVEHQYNRIPLGNNIILANETTFEGLKWCWRSQKWRINVRGEFIAREPEQRCAALMVDLIRFRINELDTDVQLPYVLGKQPDVKNRKVKKV